jgi:hypothetical protein
MPPRRVTKTLINEAKKWNTATDGPQTVEEIATFLHALLTRLHALLTALRFHAENLQDWVPVDFDPIECPQHLENVALSDDESDADDEADADATGSD